MPPKLVITLVLAAACGSSPSKPTCVEPATGLPDNVFCTGLYDGTDPTAYAADVLPYTPGVVLWSDGAEKHRYLFLPPGTTIDTSDQDVWKFPVGTKAWKEFIVDGVRVETRLFSKRSDTVWDAGTYVWDSTGTEAALNTSPTGIILPSGYEIPKLKDCDKCHHGGADQLLGLEAVALALPEAQGANLTALVQMGALSNPPPTSTIQLPNDTTGKAAAALAYVHANCGMPCHSTRGLGDETKLVLRLRADELWPTDGGAQTPVEMTDIYRSTIGQNPTTASIAQKFPGALRVTPGDHTKSLIWLVAHLRDNLYQMPPLVSHRIDDAGTQSLQDWIDALPPAM